MWLNMDLSPGPPRGAQEGPKGLPKRLSEHPWVWEPTFGGSWGGARYRVSGGLWCEAFKASWGLCPPEPWRP